MAVLSTVVVLGTMFIAANAAGAALTKDKPTTVSKPNQRRTREDYYGTSFTHGVNTYIAKPPTPPQPYQPPQPVELPELPQVVTPPQPIQPVNPNTYTGNTGYSQSLDYNYYTDPYQVNSLADVVLNKEAKDLALEDMGMEWATNIPVLQEILVGVDLIKRDFVEPFTDVDPNGPKRGWAEVGMNVLMGTAETLDIVANPVKGFFQEGPEGFVNAMGWGDQGRVNYNINVDSGNRLTDFLLGTTLEVMSDPLNWVTFGGAAVGKSAVKSTVSDAVTKAGVTNADDFIEATTRSTSNSLFRKNKPLESIVNTYNPNYKMLRDLGYSDDAIRAVQGNLSEAFTHGASKNILKGVQALRYGFDKLDTALMYATPVGYTFSGVKLLAKPFSKLGGNAVTSMWKKYSKKLSSLDDLEIIDINKMNAKEIAEVVQKDKTVTTIGDVYPKEITGLPTHDLLVKRWQEFEMYSDNKDVNTFLNELYNNGDIDLTLKNTLSSRPEFMNYYNTSLAVEGAALESLYKAIDDNTNLVYAKLRSVIDSQPDKASQLLALDEAWRDILGLSESTTNVGLNNYRVELDRQVRALKTKLRNPELSLLDQNYIQADLMLKQQMLDTFDELIKALDVDLLQVPNRELLERIKQIPSNQRKDFVDKSVETLRATTKKLKQDINILAEQKATPELSQLYTELNIQLSQKARQLKEMLEVQTFISKVSLDGPTMTVNTTIDNLKKLDDVSNEINFDLQTSKILDKELPPVKQDSVEYEVVTQVYDNIGLNNPAVIQDILDTSNYVMDNGTLVINGINYTPEQLYILQEIISLDLDKDFYQILDLLYDLDAIDFDSNTLKIRASDLLDPNDKFYSLKLNQLEVHRMLIQAIEEQPALRAAVYDIAGGTRNTPLGDLVQALDEIEVDTLTLDMSAIRNLQRDARAYVNYTKFINDILNSKFKQGNMHVALLDWIAGKGYQTIDEVMVVLSTDGTHIDLDKLYDVIDRAVNSVSNSGIYTNSGMHSYLGLGELTDDALHNAVYDIDKVTHENFMELLKRDVTKLDEGEIFVEFDLETTGLAIDGTEQVLQVYGHRYQKIGDDIMDLGSFERVIKYNDTHSRDLLPDEVKSILGPELLYRIDNSTVNEMDALLEFKEWIGEATLVTHNGDAFDIPFLSERLGIDLNNRSVDTYKLIKKLVPKVEIPRDGLNYFASVLGSYLHNQSYITNNVVKLIDKQTLNGMYDFARTFLETTAPRFRNGVLTKQMTGNVLTEALESLIGKRTFQDFTKGLSTSETQEFIDGVITSLNTNADQSLIVTLRDVLTQVKDTNRIASRRIISKSDMIQQTGHITNAYAFMNSDIKNVVNGYRYNKYATKKVYSTNKALWNYKQAIDTRSAIVDDYALIMDDSVDVISKIDADARIAANGSNLEQAARMYYITQSISRNATTDTNRTIAVDKILTKSFDKMYKDIDELYNYTKKLASTRNATTKTLRDEIAILETISILESSPRNLAAFMFNEAPRIVVNNSTHNAYAELVNVILKNKEAYQQAGIVITEKNNKLILDLIDDINFFQAQDMSYSFKQYKPASVSEPSAKTILSEQERLFNKANAVRANKIPFNAHNTASNNIYADDWGKIYELTKDLADGKGTLAANREYMTSFFKTSDARRSYINLGDFDSRRGLYMYHQDPFRSVVTDVQQSINRADGHNKFIEINFTKELSMGGSMYSDLSDKDMLNLFKQSDDYVAMVLIEGKKGTPRVRIIKPSTIKQIQNLKQLDAVIAPRYYANKVYSTINRYSANTVFGDNKLLQVYYKYILSTYQSILLLSPGMLMRNFSDVLVKNTGDAGAENIITSQLSFARSMQDWIKYENTVREIIETNPSKVFNRHSIDNYFNVGNPQMTREVFDEVHEYAMSNVSSGMSEAQQQLIEGFYTKQKASKFDQLFFDNRIRKLVEGKFMNANNHIEHAGRLSSLRLGKANGLSKEAAYAQTLRTHFDYGTKNTAMIYGSLIIPFITFPLYNLKYWLDAAFENPWIARILIDASQTSIGVEDYNQFTLDHSFKLQNAITSGNIIIGDTQWKLSPSFFDAIKLVTQPGDEFKSRLITPLRNMLMTEEEKRDAELYENVTNLDKIGLGEVEDFANDQIGLYGLTRLANNITKGIALLDPEWKQEHNLESTNHIADVIGSVASEFKFNNGARLGDTFTATQYPNISYRAGYNYNRMPYTRRYYSPSYNWYNSWKASRVTQQQLQTPASPERLQYEFKGHLYDLGMATSVGRGQARVNYYN